MASTTNETNPLDRKWCIFEHKNWKAYTKLATFDSVENFWGYWDQMPLPSTFFYNGQAKGSIAGREVEAFSIFEHGIEPTWEDPQNLGGAMVCFKTEKVKLEALDTFWENLALALISGDHRLSKILCGIRVADKSKSGKYKSPTATKLELWLRTACDEDPGMQAELKELFESCLSDGSGRSASDRGIDVEFKPHPKM